MLELNKIYNGDCLEVMNGIDDKSVDMILCDLPYGTTHNEWDSVIPLNELWEQYNRIIKGNGAIILTSSQPFTTDLINSNRSNFRYEIIWEKSIGYNPLLCKKQPLKTHENVLVFYKDLSEVKHSTENYKELRNYFKKIQDEIGVSKKEIIQNVGHSADHCFRTNSSQWSLPTEKTYLNIKNTFDLDLLPYDVLKEKYDNESDVLNKFTYNPQMTKGRIRDKKPVVYGDKGDRNWGSLDKFIGDENVNDEYYPKSVLHVSNANQREKVHPTQKPVELFEWLIKTYTNDGELVLDNCIGSGTTAIACLNTGRNYIGIEKDNTYYELANKRINEHKESLLHN